MTTQAVFAATATWTKVWNYATQGPFFGVIQQNGGQGNLVYHIKNTAPAAGDGGMIAGINPTPITMSASGENLWVRTGGGTVYGVLNPISDMAAIGSPDDAAATGTGSFSAISMLKALWLKGKANRVSVTDITCSAAAYSAYDAVGGLLTFANLLRTDVDTGLIQFASVDILNNRSTNLTLWLFNAIPTNSTYADKTPFVLNKLDVSKRIGVISLVNAATGNDGGGNGIQSVYNSGPLAMPVGGTTNGTVYGVLVTEAAMTPTTTSDFQKVTLSALPD